MVSRLPTWPTVPSSVFATMSAVFMRAIRQATGHMWAAVEPNRVILDSMGQVS